MPTHSPNTTIPSFSRRASRRLRLAAAIFAALIPGLATLPAHAQAAHAQAAHAPAAQSEDDDAPSPPAAAPPAPVVLGDQPSGSGPRPRALPPIALVPGIQALPEGGWRLTGTAAQSTPSSGILAVLSEIGRLMAEQQTGRVTVLAQAAGPKDDESIARRTSLSRGLAVRGALEAGGLAGTRIDIRPLGMTAEATDAVTILPPGTPQPTIQR